MLRPIHSQSDCAFALREIGRLSQANLGTDEADAFELWAMAVHAYEDQQSGEDRADPVDILLAEMQMNDRSQTQLAALIGANRASEVLYRRLPLTLDMIRILQREWEIPADLLVEKYETKQKGVPIIKPGDASSENLRNMRARA